MSRKATCHITITRSKRKYKPRTDIKTLALEQGVEPINNPEELKGNFWPSDETDEELLRTLRQWRNEE